MSITRSDFALLEATGKNLEVRNDLKNDLIKGNKKLHNRSAKGSANDEADAVDDKSERRSHVKDGVYEWYGPTGKLHSAPIQEGADVIITYFARRATQLIDRIT